MKKILLVIACVLLFTLLLASCQEAVSVIGAHINEDGELIIEMSNGINKNMGTVVGTDGEKGERGDRGPMGEKGESGDVAEKLNTVQISEWVLKHTVKIGSCNSLGVEFASGSGVIYAANDGVYTVITNEHVIRGASEIKVKCYDAKEYTAIVVTKNASNDVAVLEFESSTSYPGAKQGDSKTITAGQNIFIAGHPIGNEFVVSFGYISNPKRASNKDQMILDASVNSGNSGGGVYDEIGRLLGIVVSKPADANVDGIGYAIPIHTVNAIVDEEIGIDELFGRLTLGIQTVQILLPETYAQAREEIPLMKELLPDLSTEEEQRIYYGVYVVDTLGGVVLQKGDRIVSVDGKVINIWTDISESLVGHKPGDTVDVVVKRIQEDGSIKEYTLQAKISETPT